MSEPSFDDLVRYIGEPWTLGHGRVLDIVHEIETSSPRVTIVVGIALIDDCLTDALRASSELQDKQFLDRCYGDRGSIRDFSVKVDLGVCFGLYGQATHRDLLKLRNLRNDAAHKTKPKGFQSPWVKGICRDLNLPDWRSERSGKPKLIDPRSRLITTISVLTDYLM